MQGEKTPGKQDEIPWWLGLASSLAGRVLSAGHSTLLLEAEEDQHL